MFSVSWLTHSLSEKTRVVFLQFVNNTDSACLAAKCVVFEFVSTFTFTFELHKDGDSFTELFTRQRIQRHPNTILQQDNARPHVARIVTAYLNENNIRVLPWPANSPDMSPIEHVWDEMKRRLRDLENPPQNRQQLQVALVNIWNEIPQAFHGNLVRGMRRRINACIATRGGHTRY